MKKSLFRVIGLFVLITMSFMLVMNQPEVKANTPAPNHISGYNNHVNNQNNWGLFGIIGVIALAGFTKRSVVQKN